ncbi:MAG: hypothetical protein HY436_01155 [Candidatus Liptonbacteria bacterium]|nr:hypothetical protein [Candidatus Liptonbacteria bacterium]
MSKRTALVVFVSFMAFGLALFALVSNGYYPVAFVDGAAVMNREFEKNYRVALHSLDAAGNIARRAEGALPLAAVSHLDIERAVFTELIEQRLIRAELARELGDDARRVVQNQLEKFADDAALRDAARNLYGLSFEEFRDDILVPQAERDVLDGRLFLEGRELDEWLSDAKRTSRVRIFSGTLFWDGAEVQARQ